MVREICRSACEGCKWEKLRSEQQYPPAGHSCEMSIENLCQLHMTDSCANRLDVAVCQDDCSAQHRLEQSHLEK